MPSLSCSAPFCLFIASPVCRSPVLCQMCVNCLRLLFSTFLCVHCLSCVSLFCVSSVCVSPFHYLCFCSLLLMRENERRSCSRPHLGENTVVESVFVVAHDTPSLAFRLSFPPFFLRIFFFCFADSAKSSAPGAPHLVPYPHSGAPVPRPRQIEGTRRWRSK